jgi:hypothetical protein
MAKPLEEDEKGEKIELVLFGLEKSCTAWTYNPFLIFILHDITPLPRVPKWIAVDQHGGHILAVLDLQSF